MPITGSVQYVMTCPNCGAKDCQVDVNYRTGEGLEFCPHCGYGHSMYFKQDRKGNYLLRDPAKGAHPDNFILVERKVESPYGYCEVRLERGCSCYCLESEERYQHLLAECRFDDKVKSVSLHRFVDGLFSTITVSKSCEPKEG
jgi:hypothetical protein